MQAYRPAFARIYNQRWGGFAQAIAPRIREFYESTPLGEKEHTLLDIACGAGHLALFFLEHGYLVTGIDLSESMLEYARQNTQIYVESGQARFLQGNASQFSVERPVGLAVSTYDALNHLENFAALQSCFRSVYAALKEGGVFIFDLNTRLGLKQNWNGVHVEDTEELAIINRGIFDPMGNIATTRITGFVLVENGLYERFEETVYNTVFDMQAVGQALLQAGFSKAYPASGQNLNLPLEDPESIGRVFYVAFKSPV